MLMWISWHEYQLQVARLFLEMFLLILLVSFAPYTIGRNFYLTHAHTSPDTSWYYVVFYIILLVIPWIIAIINFLISNHRYHRDTDDSWMTLLKKRKISFLKIGLFFERFVMFVLIVFSSLLSTHMVTASGKFWANVTYLTFWGWIVIFGTLTFYRYLVREAKRRVEAEEKKSK